MINFHEFNEMMNRSSKGTVSVISRGTLRVSRMIGGGTLAQVSEAVREFEDEVRSDVGEDGEVGEATLESGYGIVVSSYVRCQDALTFIEKLRGAGWKSK